ncbi:hypothetical protein ABIA38_003858 [Embleya sp. AB8]
MWADVVMAVGRIVDGVLVWSPLPLGVLFVGWALFGVPRRPLRGVRPQPSASIRARPRSCGLVRTPRRPGPLVSGCPCLFGHGADMSAGHADTLPGRTVRAARTRPLTCADTCPDMSHDVAVEAPPDGFKRTCPYVSGGSCPCLSGRVHDDDRS